MTDLYPLTNAQKRVWYSEKLFPYTSLSNLGFKIHIKMSIDVEKLKESIEKFIYSEDVMRVRLKENANNEPYQYVSEYKPIHVPIISEESINSCGVDKWLQEQTSEPLELYDSPLYQFKIIKLKNKETVLYIKFHHIIIDGISTTIATKSILKIYNKIIAEDDSLEKNPLKYLNSDEEYERSRRYIKDKDFWLNEFVDFPEYLDERTEKLYNTSTNANRLEQYIPKKLQEKMDFFCKDNNVSINTLLTSVLYISYSRYTNSDDIVIGTNFANRTSREKDSLGMFVSTTPLRMTVDYGETTLNFIKAVESKQKQIMRHYKFPYNNLLSELRRQHKSHQLKQLYTIALEYQEFPMDDSNVYYEGVFGGQELNEFYFHFKKRMDTGEIYLHFDYRLDIFNDQEAEMIVNRYFQLLNEILEKPNKQVLNLELCTKKERTKLLDQFNSSNGSIVESPKHKHHTVLSLFEEKVKQMGTNTAAVYKNEELTYDELNNRANLLAHELIGRGIQPGQPIGLMMERSLELVVGILAILKVGGVYLPIDPEYPKERINYMLKDSQVSFLLTNNTALSPEKSSFSLGELILINLDKLNPVKGSVQNPRVATTAYDTAYTIYTSGTTGKPKGINVSHRTITNLMNFQFKETNIPENGRVLQFTSIGFDVSLQEIFSALLGGGTLYLITNKTRHNVGELLKLIERYQVEVLFLPAAFLKSLFHSYKKQVPNCIKHIITAGEQLHVTSNIKNYLTENNISLHNHYGPAETHVVTTKTIEPKGDIPEKPSIGKPITNAQIYILNKYKKLQPIGIAGEMYISGMPVSNGYINKPKLTKEKYIPNPFDSNEKMYKTGDLAKWLPTGEIEFLGRNDNQVKVRGHRVELGEIESVLTLHKNIDDAKVVDFKNNHGDTYLCAYIVASENIAPSLIKEYISTKLPDYMIPPFIVQLEGIPLNVNGKTDKAALPKPSEEHKLTKTYEPPKNNLEETLITIWNDVLNCEGISANSNFFELGGNSLNALMLMANIHKHLNVDVQVRVIFEHPTIRELSNYIRSLDIIRFEEIPRAKKQSYYPVSSAQKRLIAINEMNPLSTAYNIPVGFYIKGDLNKELLEEAFHNLIMRHEALRTSFKAQDGEFTQIISNYVDFSLERKKLEESELKTRKREFIRPFDLSQAPLFRAELITLDTGRYVLLLDFHHIISDGASLKMFLKELSDIYNGEKLDYLPIQYKDFAVWQNENLESHKLNGQQKYWLEELNGNKSLELPIVKRRSSFKGFSGDKVKFTINRELTRNLKKLTKKSDTTIYMTLLAIYNTLLYKYTKSTDIIVGSPVAGRAHADLSKIMGVFVNTLPLRNFPDGRKTFCEFLEEVKEKSLISLQNQEFPFEKMVEKLGVTGEVNRNPIIDTMFSVQDFESYSLNLKDTRSTPQEIDMDTSKFDISLLIEDQKDTLNCLIEFNNDLFNKKDIIRLSNHFMELIDQITKNPVKTLEEYNILTVEEKDRVLVDFNKTDKNVPENQTIQQMFEEQVLKVPNKTALILNNKEVTYQTLNKRANQLARTLRNKGVKPDQPVGIVMDKSIDMITGILAILKSGGAYVPIESDYPIERIEYIINNSGANLIISDQQNIEYLTKNISFDGIWISADNCTNYNEDTSNLKLVNSSRDLAYIIHTSGTTGKPKGVMMEHIGIPNLVMYNQKVFNINEDSRIGQFASISFDASVYEIWTALLTGSTLVLIQSEVIQNYKDFEKYVNFKKVTHLVLPPTYLRHLEPNTMCSLEKIISAGSAIKADLAKNWGKKLINAYGPTESTVQATIWENRNGLSESSNVPIGKPMNNIKVYILNNSLVPQPIGVSGEICISGIGLARGYLNLSETTDEKFISSPFISGERLYRTGDLGRWLSDGNIEFLGRVDHQVKVRGYRIELEEIESVLLSHKSVKDAAVVDHMNTTGETYISAFITSHRKLKASDINDYLLEKLPSFMLPSFITQLDTIPLTHNGKVDRKTLLKLEENEPKVKVDVVLPKTENEKVLLKVWEEILGIKGISVHDRFFTIGGDSIKAIQISTKLKSLGYDLKVKTIFEHPTIQKLGGKLSVINKELNQEIVTGEVPMTPIQEWFFEQDFTDKHHFNQSALLFSKEAVNPNTINSTLSKIVEHHDALRMNYVLKEDEWMQLNKGVDKGAYDFEIEEIPSNNVREHINERANRLQESMDIEKGPLMKAVQFKTLEGDYLLLVIHHLVVDGVSWRILLEDINIGISQASSSNNIKLTSKTTSYKEWAEQLRNYANSRNFKDEKDYWSKIENQQVEDLPKDNVINKDVYKDSREHVVELSSRQTEYLLKNVHKAFNTEINDILITALGITLKEWASRDRVLLNMEGHGREEIPADVDITRTVGWFTTQFPVMLDLPSKPIYKENDFSAYLILVKETLRKIPNQGIGYGVYKYLSKRDNPEKNLLSKPEVNFNYLGQFSHENENNQFNILSFNNGRSISQNLERTFAIDLNSMIKDNVYRMEINYNSKQYTEENINNLGRMFKDNLEKLIHFCLNCSNPERTPSDYGKNGLSIEELRSIRKTISSGRSIEKIYNLSPMQEGILYHVLYEETSTMYFLQMCLDINGELDIEKFEKSINKLINKHESLRTNFFYQGLTEAKQIVMDKRELKVQFEDISYLTNREINDFIESLKLKDRKKGFNLKTDLLIRVMVLKVAHEKYKVIWSTHHIIVDGWSNSLILKELFQIYRSLREGNVLIANDSLPYSDYIDWLNKQDKKEAMDYWKDLLSGYEDLVGLPSRDNNEDSMELKESLMSLDKSMTEKLFHLTKKYEVTLNSIVQGIWAILLQKYNNKDDIVFGTVVSGRDPDIDGIDQGVGLFINTIPVRIKAENTTFSKWVQTINKTSLSSQEYAYSPLYEIQEKASAIEELFNHILVFENYPMSDEMKSSDWDESLGFHVSGIEAKEHTNYPLNLIFYLGQGLELKFQYDENKYDGNFIDSVIEHFKNVIYTISDNPDIELTNIDILTEKEKEKVIVDFNKTDKNVSEDKTLQELFEEQVIRVPNKTAVIINSEEITYQALNKRANQLARTLRNKGVRPDQPVGIIMDKSIEMITGILAILKSGGAYLPIESDYPIERIEYIINNSGSNLIISDKKNIEHLIKNITYNGTWIDAEDCKNYDKETSNLKLVNSSRDLAYIIHTSGTTGKPKGVMMEHIGVPNLVMHNQKVFKLEEESRIGQFASISFDASVEEIWTSLISGITLVLIPKRVIQDYTLFEQYVNEFNVTNLILPPAYLGQLRRSKMGGLKTIVSAGSASSLELAEKWQPIYNNGYGPTESTVKATLWDGVDNTLDIIPIGKPIDNTRVYILNNELKPQPIGVTGEICISSIGLARGYLNLPETTEEKFIANPFVHGGRLYKTGDLGRWLPSGNIEFLGRADQQVKVRGYRIELGEIQTVLLRHPLIKDVAVIDQVDAAGEACISAFVTSDHELITSKVKEYLLGKLPSFMVPSFIIQVEKIPLNHNGKIDKNLLELSSNISNEEPLAANNELEERLTEIWEEILYKKGLGTNQNFFDLGGNSLKAISLIGKVKKSFRIPVSLKSVYQYPTIKEFAKYIKSNPGKDDNPILLLNKKKEDYNVFCFPPITGYGTFFSSLAKNIKSHTLYAFDFVDHENRLSIYMENILNIQNEGPYILMGYSAGGPLIFELAQYMESKGYEVSDLIMLDSRAESNTSITSQNSIEEQTSKDVEYFISQQKYSHYFNEITREELFHKIKGYYSYIYSLVNKGKIHGRIHLVEAEDSGENFQHWDTLTNKYIRYKGYGVHDEMLINPNLQDNSNVIQNILNKVKATLKI
ncbi:non-ribosomal peptide synthetase [Virgibacillus sp. Bac332]|uniref:non-ribosomal peptide synthetase n=1 Tax=Virgibacillus sp. Bac332 TaxID=2419842 RepID=UPI000EF4B4AD|nr:non-ribosomal peptide synthetase [Virgibacillus sp. Bac332]